MPYIHDSDGHVVGHISVPDEITEWWDVPASAGTVLTTCCHCRMPAEQARYRKVISHGGYTANQQVCCKPGHGCEANPRRKIGMWNRPWPEYED